MFNQILNAIAGNPWVLAVGTIAFFTIKGILWLLIPFLVIRWRRLVTRRHQEGAKFPTESLTSRPGSSYVQESKRAA